MKRLYKIGEVLIKVECPDLDLSDHLSVFETDDGIPDLTFRVRLAENVHSPEEMPELFRNRFLAEYSGVTIIYNEHRGGILARIDSCGEGVYDVLLDSKSSDSLGYVFIMKIIDLPRRMLASGCLFLHASVIDAGGKAILFTGKKQIGKSTQAALWERYREAKVLNGDRVLIRMRGDRCFAYGSPYCGTSDICHNFSLPVRSVVILRQSPENSVRQAQVREAVRAMLDGCTFRTNDAESVENVMEIISDIVTSVPFYVLECTPDIRAVKKLEEILNA